MGSRAKTKALISFAVTAKLICVFVFAYAKIRFSHDAAPIFLTMIGSFKAIHVHVLVKDLKILQNFLYNFLNLTSFRPQNLWHVCIPWPEVTKLFSSSTVLSMKFILLINVLNMGTIVGILAFIIRIND